MFTVGSLHVDLAEVHRLVARDRTCRAPGCRVAARHCDVDRTDD
jgi:hypothetical protein